jgi:hypothetical protein
MDKMSNQIHSRRTANGIPMFRGAVMAGLLASTLAIALPSITFADGDGNRGKHSLVQQPYAYGLQSKSPFAATFATAEAIQVSMAALQDQINALTVANVKLEEKLTTALNAATATLETKVGAVDTKVAALDKKTVDIIPDLAKYLKVDTTNVLNGVIGPHILFSGVNVHVRNGSKATDNNDLPYQGLGNLIIGYNEDTSPTATLASARKGSHNLVGGSMNSFSSVGGMVFGVQNTARGQYASVLGGSVNLAQGTNSTVYGGWKQTAGNLNSYAPVQTTKPTGGGE